MGHTELDLRERRAIEEMLNAKMPVSKIAAEIGGHPSTIYRDIKRNGFVDDKRPNLNGYYGMVAQRTSMGRHAVARNGSRGTDAGQEALFSLPNGQSMNVRTTLIRAKLSVNGKVI